MFEIEEIKIDSEHINIVLKSSIDCNDVKAEFRLKDMDRFLVTAYSDQFEVEVKSNGKNHEFSLDLSKVNKDLLLKDINKQIVWLYIKYDNNYYELKLNDKIKEFIRKQHPLSVNSLCNIVIFKRDNNTLGFRLDRKNILSQITDLIIDDKKMLIKIYSKNKESNEQLEVNNLYIKKRVFKNVLLHSEELTLNKINSNEYYLNLSQLNDISFDEVSNLDLVVEIKDNNTIINDLVKVDNKNKGLKEKIIINDKYNSQVYVTAKNTLSIRVEKTYRSLMTKIVNLNEEELEFEIKGFQNFTIDNISKYKLTIYRCNKLYNDYEYIKFHEDNISVVNDNKIFGKINLINLFGSIKSNYVQEYKIKLEINDEDKSIYDLKFEAPIAREIKTSTNILNININTEGICKIISNNKKIKLGILGTCFSRAAFNTNNLYYNPDYKLYYEISYSHFWPSVISITSDPIEFNRYNYYDISDKEIKHISREYDKTTLKELSDTDVDFVVIDFFVDAIHGIRKLKDGRYLGHNGTMHKAQYYKTNIMRDTEQFDYRNEDFYEVWKSRCDEFISKLREIIEDDKIILNLGGLAFDYLDDKDNIKSFIEDKKHTNQQLNYYNMIWQKMNNYFITKVPNAKILDMSKYKYKSSIKHPINLGPHHYEHAYYKSFVGELSKVLISNLSN